MISCTPSQGIASNQIELTLTLVDLLNAFHMNIVLLVPKEFLISVRFSLIHMPHYINISYSDNNI
jgi:hypothetical protein